MDCFRVGSSRFNPKPRKLKTGAFSSDTRGAGFSKKVRIRATTDNRWNVVSEVNEAELLNFARNFHRQRRPNICNFSASSTCEHRIFRKLFPNRSSVTVAPPSEGSPRRIFELIFVELFLNLRSKNSIKHLWWNIVRIHLSSTQSVKHFVI